MQCPRCGAPDVLPPSCDVCGAALPVARPSGRGQRSGAESSGRGQRSRAESSGQGRRSKPGTLASFFSATSTSKRSVEAEAPPVRPRTGLRRITGLPGRASRANARQAIPQFPAMHERPRRAAEADAGEAPGRGDEHGGGPKGMARGARARANARERTSARMPAARPADDEEGVAPWMAGAESDRLGPPGPGAPNPSGHVPAGAPSGQWPADAGFAADMPPAPMQRTRRAQGPMMPSAMMPGATSGPMMPNPMPEPMLPGMGPGMGMPGGARRPVGGPLAGFELGHKAVSALIIVGVVVVLAIPVLFGLSRISALTPPGQSAQSVATRVPPAQAPSGFASFVGDAYSVAYPSRWSHGTKNLATSQGAIQADVFGDGQGAQALIAIGQPMPTNQLQMLVDDVAQRYFAPNLPQIVGQAGPRTYGGSTWATGDYTVATGSLGSQTVYELRVLAANFGAQTAVVVFQAKQQDFAAMDSASFGPLIGSFRFG